MTDHPELRASAAQAQEIDDLTSTVAARDARIAELKAALQRMVDAFGGVGETTSPALQQAARALGGVATLAAACNCGGNPDGLHFGWCASLLAADRALSPTPTETKP